MTTKDEALKLALEALEYISSHYMSLPKIGCMALAAVEEALAEQPAQPGWKLVPVEPTREMINAGVGWGRPKSTWEAMIDAAPRAALAEQPAQQQPDELTVWKARAMQAEAVIAKFMEQPAQQRIEELLEIFKDFDQCGPLLGMGGKRIGCVNHDCDKCKAQQQEPVVWTATRLWNRKDTWTCPADIEKDLLDGCAPPAQQQEPVTIPREDSQEAADAIQAMLAEYQYPANPTNAARAGWRAARLYTSPPAQRKPWVGLTNSEWQAIVEDNSLDTIGAIKMAIEAKLREKNA